MARKTYWYLFEDGCEIWSCFSRDELNAMVRKHGKLIRKIAD